MSISDSTCVVVWYENMAIFDVKETGSGFITVFLNLIQRFKIELQFPTYIGPVFYDGIPTRIKWKEMSFSPRAIEIFVKKSNFENITIPLRWKDPPSNNHFFDSRFNRIIFTQIFNGLRSSDLMLSEVDLGCHFELGKNKPKLKVNIYKFNIIKPYRPVMYFNEIFDTLLLGAEYKYMLIFPRVCERRVVFPS